MLVRRMATVMISAPLVFLVWCVLSWSLYLPVPTSRRDWYYTPTMMISAPLASTAGRVSSRSLYLPVPTSRRDWYSTPAMMSGSRSVCAMAVSWYCNKERGIIARACCAAQSLESPAPLAPFISSRAFDGAALGPCGVRLTHDHDYRGACRRLNR